MQLEMDKIQSATGLILENKKLFFNGLFNTILQLFEAFSVSDTFPYLYLISDSQNLLTLFKTLKKHITI